MRLILASVLFIVAAGAQAEDCSKWGASMEEGEGGSRMVARICNATGSELTIECGAPGALVMGFGPPGGFAPPGGNPEFTGRFSIKVGSQSFERDMTYADMDSLLYLDLKSKDDLATALGKAEAISFTSTKAGIAETKFTLNGAAAALKKVKAACPRG